MTAKTFPLAVVISAHSGILLTESFGDIAPLMDHVLGRPLFDFQYPAEYAKVKAALELQHPFLADLDVPCAAKGNFSEESVAAFLAEVATLAGTDALYVSTVEQDQ